MALPEKGYLPGVDRIVLGNVVDGQFTPADEPEEGFIPGVLHVQQVTIDSNGIPSIETDDSGTRRVVSGTVSSGVFSANDQPQQGLNPGVYRATTDPLVPEEGLIAGDAGIVVGSVSSGEWTADTVTYQTSIYQASKAVTTTEQFENIASQVTAFEISGGDVNVTLTVDGVSKGTVNSGQAGVIEATGSVLGYTGSGSGTANIGQGVVR